jgi:hypothetical protein
MTRPTSGKHGNERRTEYDTQRIGADDVSRRGYRDAEVTGNVWKQTHHDELARTDAEPSDGQS